MIDDEEFLQAFESATWPLNEWRHRDHIKLAYLYLCRYPLETAVEKTRDGIRAYNTAQHVPDGLTRGYHETLTQAWLQLVHVTLCEFGPRQTADEFADAHPQLLSKQAVLFFYSRERIMSAEAKQKFIEPDLAALPRSKKRPVGT
jgi:hypothetical protein